MGTWRQAKSILTLPTSWVPVPLPHSRRRPISSSMLSRTCNNQSNIQAANFALTIFNVTSVVPKKRRSSFLNRLKKKSRKYDR